MYFCCHIFRIYTFEFQQLDAAMKTMNLEKITAVMDKFEKSFENLDLTTSVMEGSMGDAMATSAPSGQVDALIQQVNFKLSLFYFFLLAINFTVYNLLSDWYYETAFNFLFNLVCFLCNYAIERMKELRDTQGTREIDTLEATRSH